MKRLIVMLIIIVASMGALLGACGGGGGGSALPIIPSVPPSKSGELLAGPLTEAGSVSSTATTSAQKTPVFDFILREAADQDNKPLVVNAVSMTVAGTGDPASGNIAWILDGPDVSGAVGAYSPTDGKVRFADLNISISDDDTTGETYTISVYFPLTGSLHDHQTFVLSIDGDTDVTADSSGSQMTGANGTIDNGSGFQYQVEAVKLFFKTPPPASAVIGEDFIGEVLVSFSDANGYTDADFAETVTLAAYTEASCTVPAQGGLSSADAGGLTKSPVAGEAGWTDLKSGQSGALYVKASSASFSACSSQVQLVQASSSGQLAGPAAVNGSVSSTVTSPADKVDVLTFTLRETAGDLDHKPLIIQSLKFQVVNQSNAGDVTWVLNGPDVTDAVGVWSQAGGVKHITFSGLNIQIEDNDTAGETYTISLYFGANPSLVDGNALTWYMDADTDVTTDPLNSSLMTGAHSNASGNIYYVVAATQLSFQAAPPAIAGTYVDFYSSVQVAATDSNGNVDRNHNSAFTAAAYQDASCTIPASGVLSSTDTGGLSHTPTYGVATWNDLKYDTWEHIYLKFTSGAYSICSPKIFMGLNGPDPSSYQSLSRIALDASYLYLFVWNGNSSTIEKLDLITGTPVSGFGSSGKQWVCDASDNISTMAEDANYIYVAGSNGFVQKACKVAKTTGAEVQIINDNFSTTIPHYHAMLLDGTSLYTIGWRNISGDMRWRMEKRDTAGNLVGGYGASGIVESDLSTVICSDAGGERGQVLTVDGQSVYLFGENECGTSMHWRVEKRDKTTGALAAGFGSGGIVTTDPGTHLDFARAIAQDATSIYIAGWRIDTKACHIEKRSKTDGSLIAAFGTNGVVETNNLRCDTTVWVSEGRLLVIDGTDMYIGGITGPQGEGTWVVEKRQTDTGALFSGFGNGGILTADSGYKGYIDSLAISGDDLYITGGQQAGANYYYRLEKRNKTTGQ